HTVPTEAESADAWMSYIERTLGPVVLAKAALEQEGRWEPARADLVAVDEEFNEATDDTLDAPAEYLLTVAKR
ncbi:MAG TPA: hypothetical protein VHR88_04265, partial [Solirubrobacteraceae bacterium]|nr:hypothetical protein [Solirubrobacteraceae bacterium]